MYSSFRGRWDPHIIPADIVWLAEVQYIYRSPCVWRLGPNIPIVPLGGAGRISVHVSNSGTAYREPMPGYLLARENRLERNYVFLCTQAVRCRSGRSSCVGVEANVRDTPKVTTQREKQRSSTKCTRKTCFICFSYFHSRACFELPGRHVIRCDGKLESCTSLGLANISQQSSVHRSREHDDIYHFMVNFRF